MNQFWWLWWLPLMGIISKIRKSPFSAKTQKFSFLSKFINFTKLNELIWNNVKSMSTLLILERMNHIWWLWLFPLMGIISKIRKSPFSAKTQKFSFLSKFINFTKLNMFIWNTVKSLSTLMILERMNQYWWLWWLSLMGIISKIRKSPFLQKHKNSHFYPNFTKLNELIWNTVKSLSTLLI